MLHLSGLSREQHSQPDRQGGRRAQGRRSVSFSSFAKENSEAEEWKATHKDRLLISAVL